MDIRQLSYFVTIAEAGNMSKAARQLNMTQPPLSIQMRGLEDELGCVLFERDTRNMNLTTEGKVLYEKAKVIIELVQTTKYQIDDLKQGHSGILHIGVVSSVSSTLFMEWINDFRKLYSNISIIMTEGNTYELIEKLRNRQIEVAIVRMPFNDYGMEYITLKREYLKVVGNERFFGEYANNDEINIEELSSLPLLIYRRWEALLQAKFGECGKKPEYVIMSDDARTIACAAKSGMGVAIIPESVVSMAMCEGVIEKKIGDAKFCSDIVLMHRKEENMSKTANSFCEWIKLYS